MADDEVRLVSKGDSRLAMPLRRIRVRREKGGLITLLSNDMARSAVEIAALYKSRWQIELLFRWIKQHLDIRKFLGTTANAIRLQILAAMIAYLLLRIAARINRVAMLALRFAELIWLRCSPGVPSPSSPSRHPPIQLCQAPMLRRSTGVRYAEGSPTTLRLNGGEKIIPRPVWTRNAAPGRGSAG